MIRPRFDPPANSVTVCPMSLASRPPSGLTSKEHANSGVRVPRQNVASLIRIHAGDSKRFQNRAWRLHHHLDVAHAHREKSPDENTTPNSFAIGEPATASKRPASSMLASSACRRLSNRPPNNSMMRAVSAVRLVTAMGSFSFLLQISNAARRPPPGRRKYEEGRNSPSATTQAGPCCRAAVDEHERREHEAPCNEIVPHDGLVACESHGKQPSRKDNCHAHHFVTRAPILPGGTGGFVGGVTQTRGNWREQQSHTPHRFE